MDRDYTDVLTRVAAAAGERDSHSGSERITSILKALREGLGADYAAVATRGGDADYAVIESDGTPSDAFPGVHAVAAEIAKFDGFGTSIADSCFSAGMAVVVQGRRVGALWVCADRELRADEMAATATCLAADRVSATLENVELRASLERAMAQILERDERMLGRMGLDIHDGPTQQLSVALLEVQLLEAELAEADRQGMPLPDALRPAMSRIYETVGGALHEMRELIGHLRPAQFEDRALPEILGDAVTAFEARSGATVNASFEGEFPTNGISITQRITFYRVLQEALANAHRHGAASHCEVHAVEDASGIRLTVTDDGKGFDVAKALRPRGSAPMVRFGLHGMRDRAELLGGTCDIESAVGEGSTITVFLPRWERPGDNSGD